MASPPAHSLAPAQKRYSDLDMMPNSRTSKRRKALNWPQSPAPLSAHPLRQASFPPEPSSPSFAARSRSFDEMSTISASTVIGNGLSKKRRGRKPKNFASAAVNGAERASSRIGDGASQISGRDALGPGQLDDDDVEDDAELNLAVTDSVRTLEQKQEEQRLRGMLVEALDDDQYSRYEVWRASKLSDTVIKRLVNTTVSQSVPPAVILAVKSVTKQFAGILVEMARQVQAEWIAAGEEQADVPHPQFRPSDTQKMILADTTPPDFRGPLRPDHLREAWRRYKVSGEGGGVGSQTFWHAQQGSGSSRFSRTGKRLFQ